MRIEIEEDAIARFNSFAEVIDFNVKGGDTSVWDWSRYQVHNSVCDFDCVNRYATTVYFVIQVPDQLGHVRRMRYRQNI